MGTPALAVPCLDALSEHHEIAVVVTQPDKIGGRGHKLIAPPVKARALQIGAPILQPRRARDEAFIEELRAFAPDAIAVVAFGQILPQSILDMAPRGCVNLHYSLLPRWRGAAPVQYATWKGDETTGVTTQWMAAQLDAGDIIQQIEVPIKDDETADELFPRLNAIGARVLVETFAMLESGTAPRAPQDESKITLAPQIEKDDAKNRLDDERRANRQYGARVERVASRVLPVSRGAAQDLSRANREFGRRSGHDFGDEQSRADCGRGG